MAIKVNEFKEILESMEVGLFDKWMVRFEKVQDIFQTVDQYLAVDGLFHANFTGVGLFDDNDTKETKQYWFDLMNKYNEIIERIENESK